MKKFFILLALAVSMSAVASHHREYKSGEMNVANAVLTICPKEISQLMTSYSQITKAVNIGNIMHDGMWNEWSIEITTTLPAPSFQTSTRILTMTETFRRNTNTAPDAPGMKREVECHISVEE